MRLTWHVISLPADPNIYLNQQFPLEYADCKGILPRSRWSLTKKFTCVLQGGLPPTGTCADTSVIIIPASFLWLEAGGGGAIFNSEAAILGQRAEMAFPCKSLWGFFHTGAPSLSSHLYPLLNSLHSFSVWYIRKKQGEDGFPKKKGNSCSAFEWQNCISQRVYS